MKYLRQFLIILLISFMGELLHYLLPLPIPASIYGIVLMLLGLTTGAIPLASVKETGMFLVNIMPVMFIPASAGVLEITDKLAGKGLFYLVMVIVSTAIVMAVSGLVTQAVVRKSKKNVGPADASGHQAGSAPKSPASKQKTPTDGRSADHTSSEGGIRS